MLAVIPLSISSTGMTTAMHATDPYCRTAADTSHVAIQMVRSVVAPTATLDAALRASLGVRAAADSEIVLITDEAKCGRAVDSLNSRSISSGGAGELQSLYLVSTGSQYAAYAPSEPGESDGLVFMDDRFHILGFTVIP